MFVAGRFMFVLVRLMHFLFLLSIHIYVLFSG